MSEESGSESQEEQSQVIPEHFRVATNDDFLCGGKKKLGMMYWLHSDRRPELQQYQLVENTDSVILSEWIQLGRCYIELSRYPEGNNYVIDLEADSKSGPLL